MNKSNIGYFLIVIALVFAGAFFLGRSSKPDVNFYGERELVLKNRIDSLHTVIDSSEIRVEKIETTKVRIKKEYETDTIYINNAPFDTLKFLFLQQYPR